MYRVSACSNPCTVAVSVSRQTMRVDGASTTKYAVVLQLPALMKQTGFRLVCGMTLYYVNVRTCLAMMTH